MCGKTADDNPDGLEYVSNRYKTQEMCNKAINDYSIAIEFVPDRYKSQKMCDRVVLKSPFSLRYVPNQYKTQKMCRKAVDDCLAPLKFVPYRFVMSKMIKKLFTDLYADENILFFNEDSSNTVFNCNEMGVLNIDLNCINLDDNNFDEDDPDTIIHVRLLSWHTKFEERKALKKELNEQLIPVALHPNR